MTCVPSPNCAWRSKTFVGADEPSVDQWKTAVGVTSAMVDGETQRQKTTASGIWWLFILAPSSRLKTWSCWPARKAKIFETCAGRLKIETATTHFHHSRRRCMATKWNHPLNDGTPRRAGFIIAASADIGRFIT